VATHKHIHITGAAGSGVSTLGVALARSIRAEAVDTDDFYWMPSEPPYRVKREIPDRTRLLAETLDRAESWVLSGSLMGWGDALIPRFSLVAFLYVPPDIRLQRIAARERERFGPALDPGGNMHDQHQAFLQWAASYETGGQGGRTLSGHQEWLSKLPCPVVRLEGYLSTASMLDRLLTNPALAENL